MQGIMNQDSSAAHLVARARNGDREAFDQLAEGQRAKLEAFIRYRLRAPLSTKVEVDDVVQDVLVRALQAIERFHGEDEVHFGRWLTGIAANVILELASQHGRQRAAVLNHDVPDNTATHGTSMRREERFERLQTALESLPSDYREVIVLARLRRLPIKEVADRLNRTPGATTQLLWRAVQKLRQSFGDTESLHLPPRSLDDDEEEADHVE